MTRTWITVADSSQACSYLYQGPQRPLQLLDNATLQHPNEPSRNLVTSRPGTRQDYGQGQRSSLTPPSDPHEYEKQKFAQRIAEFLHERAEDYDRLVVVAPAPLLGRLRKLYSRQVEHRISDELDKELAQLPEQELRKHLQEVLNIDPRPRRGD